MSLQYQKRSLILFDPQNIWKGAVRRNIFYLSTSNFIKSQKENLASRIIPIAVCSTIKETKEQLLKSPNSFLFFSLDHCFDNNESPKNHRPVIQRQTLEESLQFLQSCVHRFSGMKYAILCFSLNKLTESKTEELFWFFLRQKAIFICRTERELQSLLKSVICHELTFPVIQETFLQTLEKRLPWRSHWDWTFDSNK